MHRAIFNIFISCCIVIVSNVIFADIHYYLTHTDDKIHVIGEFSNYIKQDKVKLIIPDNILGTEYGNQIKNIKILNGVYNSNDGFVTLGSQLTLTIEYDIISLPVNNFIRSFANKSYHYIDKSKFFILGEGFFIFPKEEFSDQKVIIYLNSPVKKVVCNFKPYFDNNPIIVNFDDLSKLIILGNEDFFTRDLMTNTKLIIWSKDKILCKMINDITVKVTKQNNRLWQDNNFKPVVIFIPNPFITKKNALVKNKSSAKVISNTIVNFINPNLNNGNDLYNLINYEDIYFWFGQGLIKGPLWFTQGFSDYYMDKINYHFSGDKQYFINNYNEKLKKYFLSPFKNFSNSYLDDHKFIYKILEKLPYLKGYLIAGQIDSIIDLDKALRRIMQSCNKTTTNCYFSKELLFKYISELSIHEKDQITKLIDNFSLDDLTDSFLNMASLKTRRSQGFRYDDTIMNFIQDGMISGSYLSNCNPKYQNNVFYTLSDMKVIDNNKLMLFIENNNQIEQFIPYAVPIPTIVPYYHYNFINNISP